MNRTIVILLVRHPSRPVAAARKNRRALRHHPVTVTKAQQKEVTEWDEYTGRLATVDEVEVRAQVSGYLESIHFKDGQIGKEGDQLLSSIRALALIGLVGDTYMVLLSGDDINGRYGLLDMCIPPGGGRAPQRHHFEEFIHYSGRRANRLCKQLKSL